MNVFFLRAPARQTGGIMTELIFTKNPKPYRGWVVTFVHHSRADFDQFWEILDKMLFTLIIFRFCFAWEISKGGQRGPSCLRRVIAALSKVRTEWLNKGSPKLLAPFGNFPRGEKKGKNTNP